MTEKYGDNWEEDPYLSDDNGVFIQSSGNKPHGRYYVLNSVKKSSEVYNKFFHHSYVYKL